MANILRYSLTAQCCRYATSYSRQFVALMKFFLAPVSIFMFSDPVFNIFFKYSHYFLHWEAMGYSSKHEGCAFHVRQRYAPVKDRSLGFAHA